MFNIFEMFAGWRAERKFKSEMHKLRGIEGIKVYHLEDFILGHQSLCVHIGPKTVSFTVGTSKDYVLSVVRTLATSMNIIPAK